MKIIIKLSIFLTLFLLTGCGDSIKDAVENLPVTKKYDLLDVLKKSKLIDSYEMKVMNDDPLKGEVALVIKLKNNAIFSNQKLLKHDKDAYLVILSRFFLSQTMRKDEWSIGRTLINGQLTNGKKVLSETFLLHPSIFISLANNEKINIDKIKVGEGFYLNQAELY